MAPPFFADTSDRLCAAAEEEMLAHRRLAADGANPCPVAVMLRADDIDSFQKVGHGEAEGRLPALRNAKREHRDSAAARAERTQQCQRSTRGSRGCSWRSRQRTTASASFSLCKRKSTSIRLQREAAHPRRVRTQERGDTERPA